MNRISKPPVVQLLGEIDHPDFADAIDLLRSQARTITAATEPPELLVVAQSRPGAVGAAQIEAQRRAAPLAGAVGLLGTWCEGESRTGRPWPGIPRLYWYEFPAWWRRQTTLRAAGRCPDWARPDAARTVCTNSGPIPRFSLRAAGQRKLIVIHAKQAETNEVLADILIRAGYAVLFQRRGIAAAFRGATAGIWDGGQLDEQEAIELSTFSRQLAVDGAPLVAVLDFPRRDTVERAAQCGAAAVIGKPWINQELIDTIALAIAAAPSNQAA